MAGKRVREPWEKYGRRGREVEAFVELMDSMSHDQWVVVGETRENRDLHEYGEALKEWHKISMSATVEKALSSLGDRHVPKYDDETVDRYTRGGALSAKSIAPYSVGIADRLPAWAVEVLLRPFVKAGVDLSPVLPEGMDMSRPLPHEA
ncbi:hypothetical protein [Propionibacterium australiense]|uniref:hypothetical protein n=1 Tax=Propionibacterium australiense TaxID=119981 RepID=UPI000E5B6C2F|nr:hypothetical protein [Propionibacterium australiense]RLP06012.1 hypothetical protein D9T14_12925 [Propionibacterium australiense]